MSNGSEHIPERCVHVVDGPDWAGLRELYPAEVEYKALVKDARDYAGSDEYGGAVLLRETATAVEALVAENEKLRPVFEFVQGLNGNIDEIHEFINSRDALQARLDSVRKYAEERAAYGRSNRTVGSARIASDLFGILDRRSDTEGEQA